MDTKEFFEDNLEKYIEIRKYLHSRPELGTGTVETAGFVKSKLDELSIKNQAIGENSIVAEIMGKGEGKTILLRGDMDALKLCEENNFPHKSVNSDLMHACGHDGHTTMLLATADYLSRNNDFNGRVLLLFQSGEEGFDGAKKIIADGLFEKFEIDLAYGLHNWPGFETGKIVVKDGAIMASEDRFYIKLKGRGGHASAPSGCVEPFAGAADIIKACQTILIRKIPTDERAVVSITKVQGGSADNIIPDSVDITGNVRATNSKVQDIIEAAVNDIVDGVCKTYGLEADFVYNRKHPVLVNTEIAPALKAAVNFAGEENLITETASIMGSEDFALFLEKVKGAMIWVGNGVDSKLLHNTAYDFNDEIIPVGTGFFVSLVKEVLA